MTTLDQLRERYAPAAERAFLGAQVDDTPAGGTLELPAGTYLGNVAVERAITIRGADPEARSLVVPPPGKAAIEVLGQGTEVTLENLVFRDAGHLLGAVAIRGDRCTVTLRNCVLFDNTSDFSGPGAGGVSLTSGVLRLERCAFWNNKGSAGGAVSARVISEVYATACLFVGNEGSLGGGAVFVDNDSIAKLVNCTLIDNIANDAMAAQSVRAFGVVPREQVLLINSVVRGRAPTFGSADQPIGPVVLRASTVPEDVQGHPKVKAFGGSRCTAPTLAEDAFPWAVAAGSPAANDGDLGRLDDPAQVGLCGGALVRDGAVCRGAAAPR